jgi:hypothetical protein
LKTFLGPAPFVPVPERGDRTERVTYQGRRIRLNTGSEAEGSRPIADGSRAKEKHGASWIAPSQTRRYAAPGRVREFEKPSKPNISQASPPVAPSLPSATRQAKAGRVPLRTSSGKSTQASPAASGRPPGGREWALLADKFKDDATATGIHPEETQEEVGNVEAVIFQAMQCDGHKEVADKLLAVRKTMPTYVVA